MLDKSVEKIDSLINKNGTVSVSVVLSPSLEIFKGYILNSFVVKKNNLVTENSNAQVKVNYYLQSAKVNYTETFKDGFFGDTYLKRSAEILGAASIENNNGNIISFQINKSIEDTINTDAVKNIEEPSLQFTKAEVPSLPLLSNLLEPIIVVGTLVVTAILLFTVRSK